MASRTSGHGLLEATSGSCGVSRRRVKKTFVFRQKLLTPLGLFRKPTVECSAHSLQTRLLNSAKEGVQSWAASF
jgi:hypothetical protein